MSLSWDHPSNRSYEPVEKRAEEIYDTFDYDGLLGSMKPKWVQGGNSAKQDEARSLARRELKQRHHQPIVTEKPTKDELIQKLIECGDELYSAFVGYEKTDGQVEAVKNYAEASNNYRTFLS